LDDFKPSLSQQHIKTEFLLFGHPAQVNKMSNPVLTPSSGISLFLQSQRPLLVALVLSPNHNLISLTRFQLYLVNVLIVFVFILIFAAFDQFLTSVQLRRIGTSLVQSKLDYCNSLYYRPTSFLKIQPNRLQHIQNYFPSATVAASRSCSSDQILRSLHWFKVQERVEYKIISDSLLHSRLCSFLVSSTFASSLPFSIPDLLDP